MGKITFAFNQDAMKKAENEYTKVQMEPFQKKGTIQMSGVINQYLNMSPIALRGFMLNVVKEWQEETGRFLRDTMAAPLEERLEILKYLLSYLEEALSRILKDPAQKTELSKVFPKVLEFYKKTLGDRSYLDSTSE